MECRTFAEPDHDDAFGLQPSTGGNNRHFFVAAAELAALAHVGKHAACCRVDRRKALRWIAISEQSDRDRIRFDLGWALGPYRNLHAPANTFLVMPQARHRGRARLRSTIRLS